MNTFEIKHGIYSVGVLNPNLRIFDIVMKTEYGTSYNAYLIKGEKTALVEAVHTKFFDEYLENIKSIVDIKDIDYIILNHTEPDHSGSLKHILNENPDIEVITSMAGNKYIQSIVNRDFKYRVVKDGETLDLGEGRILKFIIAPFLHWPDSMFTFVEKDNLLFSCDFLGAHYCEPRMFNNLIAYPDKYQDAAKFYYDVIFSPFKEHVLKGIEKIAGLKIDYVCTSHGPILIEGIDEAIRHYKEWSSDVHNKNEIPKVVIPYVSAYGCTERMAKEIKRGIESAGNIEVELFNIIYNDLAHIKESIEKADALLFGAPTINRDAVKPIWDILSVVEVPKNQGKLCGVFGSYGWSGEGIKMLEERVKSLKLKLFGEGMKANFVPSEEELEKLFEYGVAFGKELV